MDSVDSLVWFVDIVPASGSGDCRTNLVCFDFKLYSQSLFDVLRGVLRGVLWFCVIWYMFV